MRHDFVGHRLSPFQCAMLAARTRHGAWQFDLTVIWLNISVSLTQRGNEKFGIITGQSVQHFLSTKCTLWSVITLG